MEHIGVISGLAPVHALFNATIALFCLCQAALGLIIRMRRGKSARPSLIAIKTHRKMGPALVIAGALGVLSGWTLVFYNYGSLFRYPYHSLTGLTIALLLAVVYAVSKKIRGADSRMRTIHFSLGVLVLGLYSLQIYLGMRILYW